MDPKIVKMAKDVPARLRNVMESMFEQSQPALRSGVSTLRDSLKKLDSYLSAVEREHLGTNGAGQSQATKKTAAAKPAAMTPWRRDR